MIGAAFIFFGLAIWVLAALVLVVSMDHAKPRTIRVIVGLVLTGLFFVSQGTFISVIM